MINQSQRFWIYCDHSGCWRSLERLSLESVRVSARRRGWSVESTEADDKSTSRKDFCPAHTPGEAP